MKFKEAFKEMKSGLAVKLPSWAGYWWWDEEAQTILMYTKDGGCLDIRETQNVEYTFQIIHLEISVLMNGYWQTEKIVRNWAEKLCFHLEKQLNI